MNIKVLFNKNIIKEFSNAKDFLFQQVQMGGVVANESCIAGTCNDL